MKLEIFDYPKRKMGKVNTVKRSEVKSFSHVQLFATPWTVVHQAPPSMEFSRQEYWSGLPFPSPGDLPKLGIEPGSPALQADALPSEPPGKPMNSMERQKDMTLKGEIPSSVGDQYAIGEEWRNRSRKNEEAEPKQKQCPAVDVTSDGSKI